MGHNFKVPNLIHERYPQIVTKSVKCGPPCEGREKWIIDYGTLPVRTEPKDKENDLLVQISRKNSPFYRVFHLG